MRQTWHDLLFAHWTLSQAVLRALVPGELPLDTFQNECWLGVVPFHMSVRARGVPALPGLSRFSELNVRTYVMLDGKPGVYFFSLDAANLAAVWAARRFYHLPYFHARMRASVVGDEVEYESRRSEGHATFRAIYRPIGPVRRRAPGTLEHWLTERYCLYTVHRGRVYRGEVHHQPWPLQDAGMQLFENTMAACAGIRLPDAPPLLHFAKHLDVLIWPPQRLK